ncbi:hypothetical protein ABID29_002316 [Streptococcus rupicaprae]|uniref:MORN repeat protein n=1 Tax=Streptococcus rupicaprae TaxID=759619 RepID=A0ABV2FKU0_9STRE
MELVAYYWERLRPHLHRRNLELATVGLILLCGLFVLLASLPRQGNVSYKDGSLNYEGQMVRRKLSGQGTLTYANGNVYEGDFSNGSFNGTGVFRAKDGWIYEGSFVNGLAHGKGKLTTETGIVYEGEFVKGVYQDAD